MANLSMLASDDNNPEFVGAKNPDEAMSVRFYKKQVENHAKSMEKGEPVYDDTIYIEISTPGDILNIINTPARSDHRKRFPRHWEHFCKSGGIDTGGTSLTEWKILKPDQIEALRASKFFTVENIAFSSDGQISSVGMSAGMEPHAFRDRAKQFLASRKGSTVAAEIASRDKEIAELKARDEKREADMAEMKAMMSQLVAQGNAPKTDTLHVPNKGK